MEFGQKAIKKEHDRILRKDYFLAGLGMRILMLAIFLVGNHYDKYNDMSEIIFEAMNNMLQGENPYSVTYELEWGSGTFTQPFNYGPVTLLFLLPAMLLPFWYNTLWVGMYVMINVYYYLLCNYMMKKLTFDEDLQKLRPSGEDKYPKINQKDPRINRFMYYAGAVFWMLPVGTLVVTNFLSLPIFLTTLAFGNRKDPFKCSLYVTLAGASYQMAFIFAPVYAIYHFKKDPKSLFKFALGALPAVLLIFLFIVWGPGGAIYSLFLYTSEMGYVKCPTCAHSFDSWAIFSVPKLAYTLSDGRLQIGNASRIVLVLILGAFLLVYLFTDKYEKSPELFIQQYIMMSTWGFVLTNNYGQLHYLLFLFVPYFISYQIKHPYFRIKQPIGVGIRNYEQFEKRVKQTHQLPP